MCPTLLPPFCEVALIVRPGQPDDAAYIRRYDEHVGDRGTAIDQGECFVAELDGSPVGYVTFSRDRFFQHPFIHYLCVEPRARRRGIAEALLARVEAEVGCRRLFISTVEPNRPMHTLLAKGGWTKAGAIDGLNKDGPPEVFYFKDLGEGA